jgi:hypothetical protein
MTAILNRQPAAPLHDPDDAVAQIMIGRVVGASFGSMYGLVGNGLIPTLGDDIAAIKGRARRGRPLSVCLPSARLARLIDPAQLHGSIRDWALDERGLARAFASQCLLRVPVRPAVAASLPAQLISYLDDVPYLQNLDPSGIPVAGAFIGALWSAGVMVPALTSMNGTGAAAIIDSAAAVRFAGAAGLPSLLTGPMDGHRGSLTIVEVGPAGISVAREGTFPSEIVRMVARHAGQPDRLLDSLHRLPC